jgi:hypothetical protein
MGRIGFVIAIVAAAIGLLQQLVASFFPYIAASYGYSSLQMAGIFGAFTFLHAAVSLGALIFGILGAQRRQSLVRAGIAIGIGAIGVMGAVIGLLAVPLVGLLL